jgi:hypothetical protein
MTQAKFKLWQQHRNLSHLCGPCGLFIPTYPNLLGLVYTPKALGHGFNDYGTPLFGRDYREVLGYSYNYNWSTIFGRAQALSANPYSRRTFRQADLQESS